MTSAEPDGARDAAARWARVWESAWAAHDKAAIARLYAAEAHFQPHPFRPPIAVQDYLDDVFGDEAVAEPVFEDPIVDGPRAAVRWHARTQLRSGREEVLSGVSVLVFDSAGLVVEQRDFWADGGAE
jgi:hypothetical protein